MPYCYFALDPSECLHEQFVNCFTLSSSKKHHPPFLPPLFQLTRQISSREQRGCAPKSFTMSKAALSKSFFHELCLNLNPSPRHSFSWHPEYNPYSLKSANYPPPLQLPHKPVHTKSPKPPPLRFFSSFSCHPIRIYWLILTAMSAAPATALAVHKEVILCFPFSVNFSDSLYYTSTILQEQTKPSPLRIQFAST